ncbi:MAG: PilZ domain-containing protein [Arenicellales bacterium]
MTDADHFFAVEKRRRRRWELVFYLRVFDQSDNSLLGHVVDISEDGLMLMSEVPIELDRDFDLVLEMPESDRKGRKKISLKAHSIWKSSDANPDLFDTGLQLINPEKSSVDAIIKLIEELQF